MPISKVSASEQWNLQVNNARTSVVYSLDQLMAMPLTTVNANLSCYGSPVANGVWSGISLSYLLEQTGLDPNTLSINFLAQDGYAVSLPLDVAMQPDVIISYQLNGTSLPETLRLVLPEYNGNMWISLITSITLSASQAQSSSSGTEATIPNPPVWASLPSPSVEIQNTSQKNETIIVPTSTPTNINPTTQLIQPTQKVAVQQGSNSKGLSLPVEVVYGFALGVTVAFVVIALVFTRKRKTHVSSPLPQPVNI